MSTEAISLIVSIIFLLGIVIPYKKADEEERHLFLKLLGCYVLGVFSFKINTFVFPVGIVLFFVLRPKVNKKAKTVAAFLGFTVLLINLIIPIVSNWLYERPTEVSLSSVNFFEINFQEEWQSIERELQLSMGVKIEDFKIEYEEDGTINRYDFQMIDRQEGQLVLYRVNLNINKATYSIRARKIDRWLQYDRLITASRFFDVLTNIDVAAMKPSGDYEYYSFSSRGEYVNYGIRDREKYIINEYGEFEALHNELLPVRGVDLQSCGMVVVDEKYDGNRLISRTLECQGPDYLLDVQSGL